MAVQWTTLGDLGRFPQVSILANQTPHFRQKNAITTSMSYDIYMIALGVQSLFRFDSSCTLAPLLDTGANKESRPTDVVAPLACNV